MRSISRRDAIGAAVLDCPAGSRTPAALRSGVSDRAGFRFSRPRALRAAPARRGIRRGRLALGAVQPGAAAPAVRALSRLSEKRRRRGAHLDRGRHGPRPASSVLDLEPGRRLAVAVSGRPAARALAGPRLLLRGSGAGKLGPAPGRGARRARGPAPARSARRRPPSHGRAALLCRRGHPPGNARRDGAGRDRGGGLPGRPRGRAARLLRLGAAAAVPLLALAGERFAADRPVLHHDGARRPRRARYRRSGVLRGRLDRSHALCGVDRSRSSRRSPTPAS